MKEKVSPEDFADYVKFMRESLKINQFDFADAIGVPVSSIRNWEEGNSYPGNINRIIANIRHVVKSRIKHVN
jgi:DNA-binding transcriptional regulator YiaG